MHERGKDVGGGEGGVYRMVQLLGCVSDESEECDRAAGEGVVHRILCL